VSKACTNCKVEKSADDFHLSSQAKDGRASHCKACVNSRKRESRARVYTQENRRKWNLQNRYKMTPAEVDAMRAKQNGCCAICAKDLQKFHIDHCHTSGRVRGLLCHRCNTRLGGVDDAVWRAAAMRYLGVA